MDELSRVVIESANEALEVTKTGVTFSHLETTVNDFFQNQGLTEDEQTANDELKNYFTSLKTGVTGVTGVTAASGAASRGNTEKTNGVTGVTELINNAISPLETPPEVMPVTPKIDRPCYQVYDDWTDYGKPGVYYHGLKPGKKDEPPVEVDFYICDPLHIEAGSCDTQQNNYGLLLKFRNQRGHWRKWLMPMEMLKGSCEELRGQLLSQGLVIDHHKRGYLPTYLQSQRPKKQLECALKVGWHNDCFVLPDRVIGNNCDNVFFQSDHAVSAEYTQRGKLSEWQQHVSRYCIGNPLLLFQVSTAFAGSLLKKCFIDYAGFHIFGDSSTGKTTGQRCAASVWGGDEFMRTWKATGNGLEAAAVLFNDGLLALDEIGDADANIINQTIYALGNGTGKQRANVKGTAKAVHKWRIVVLSNGEKTIEAHFQEKGLSAKAGQLVRLLQIPVSGKYGAFDELHDLKDGRLLSDTIKKNCGQYYGAAGIAYLKKLVADSKDFGGLLEEVLKQFISDDLEPQEQRAARAFALVALAGELATEYGITQWEEGAALDAALLQFQKWREFRGRGNTEDKTILELIKDFIDKHGDSRFSNKSDDTTINNRAGWYGLNNDDQRVYYFTSVGLKEATPGYDIKRVIEALVKAKWLDSGASKSAKLLKVGGRVVRAYEVLPS